MARPRKKASPKRGKGTCGTRQCFEPKAPDHFLCANHLEEVERVKEKLDEEERGRSRRSRRSKTKVGN